MARQRQAAGVVRGGVEGAQVGVRPAMGQSAACAMRQMQIPPMVYL